MQPFYLPLALFVPPSHAVIHKELNLLYQFWIHTELVTSLGPLVIYWPLIGPDRSRDLNTDL